VQETRTTCPYCGVGCGVVIEHEDGRIAGVRGDPAHPANRGMLCSKGRTLHLTATPQAMRARLTHPTVRGARATWDAALDEAADAFARCIGEHGPDSVAFYISGQLLTEDYYVFNKLAKGLIGTNNVDTNSRLCMSSAVAGYKATLGSDAPPACYDDIDHAKCLFIAGSNAAWTHPILYRRIEAARRRDPSLRTIAVDPRRTATAGDADLHLQIEPGTDVALFHGMLHVMLWEELVDRAFIAAHTEGFEATRAIVREYTPKLVAQTCGIEEEAIVTAARWFARGPTLSLYCQGLNQSSSGTAKNAALVNLHLATGQVGRAGTGPFSLTGQPNAMGGREVGGLANLLSAHRDLANPAHRAEVAALWGVERVPESPGLTAVELFDALAAGRVKMVWIACTNPAQSMPDQATVRKGLERAELVVLQEAYAHTETSAFAHIELPASSWGEKEGTVTNSERRISRVRAALRPPGEARADWQIAVDFARRLEARLRRGMPTLFPYASVDQVFDEHVRTTRGRDLDITGLSHARLDAIGPQQWPCRSGDASGTARLYTDRRFATADGRARFAAMAYAPVVERVDARYPFRLNTGRLRDQWHAMSRTGTVPALFAHVGEPAIDLHPADAARRGLADGDLVRVESRRGSVVVPVAISEAGRVGSAFLPMHWGEATLPGAGSAGISAVTAKSFCAVSRQPELKHAAVRIVKAKLPWRLVAFARGDDLVAMRCSLREHARAFDYASLVLQDGAHAGVVLRAAHGGAGPARAIDAIDAILGLDAPDVLRYDDGTRGVGRRFRIVNGQLAAVRLAGDATGDSWLREWLVTGTDVSTMRSLLLFPRAQPPRATPARSRVVCSCHGVTERAIAACAGQGDAAHALARVQDELRCGTGCGSCMPEVRGIVAAHARLAAA
jgi:assimilatory nitrate reductase catalytic subunit